MDHPELPRLESVRFHLDRLFRATGLSNRRVAEICNASQGDHEPRVTADTVRRIRGGEAGHGVRYSTVVHVYNTLRALAKPIQTLDVVTELANPTPTILRPSWTLERAARTLGLADHTFGIYERVRSGVRSWNDAVSLVGVEEAMQQLGPSTPLEEVEAQVLGGRIVHVRMDTTIQELLRDHGDDWDLCVVMEHARRVYGAFGPVELQRVVDPESQVEP